MCQFTRIAMASLDVWTFDKHFVRAQSVIKRITPMIDQLRVADLMEQKHFQITAQKKSKFAKIEE